VTDLNHGNFILKFLSAAYKVWQIGFGGELASRDSTLNKPVSRV